MALFNVMVLNGNSYPVVAAIRDCTGHLSKAGKKDALFIAGVFSGLLLDFDAEKTVWAYSISTALLSRSTTNPEQQRPPCVDGVHLRTMSR